MKQILIYSDSLTWGIIPTTRKRLPFDKRWPGIMENRLIHMGQSVRIIEDCVNGRRTAWHDPYKPGRNGLETIAVAIEAHSPLSLVVIMLGTNDFQSMHPHTAWHSSQGVAALVDKVRSAPIEPGMPIPPILIITPPLIQTPKGPIAPKFENAEHKCAGLGEKLREVADSLECHYFDANDVTTSSKIDGIHLDADQHETLGLALASKVSEIISDQAS